MIAFSCPACQKKWKVEESFAGQSSQCPSCKQSLAVPGPPPKLRDLPSADWDRLDEIVGRFEEAWQDGQRPALADFLAVEPRLRPTVLVELIHADMEFRRRAGENVQAAAYLRQYPELAADRGAADELLRRELELRQETAANPLTLHSRGTARRPVMIAFSCPACQMKLKVDERFAGRSSKCPTCKKPLTVPQPSATVAYAPPQKIDGQESCLTKNGIEDGVTLDNDPTERKPLALPDPRQRRPVSAALASRKQGNERYVIEGEIARGGMGAVLRAVDCDLRREVAVKYMLDEKDPRKRGRFIEEAQINAQLEHPNIVPVYDLGIDAQKRPYLMMKMVRGQSLKEVIDQLRGGSMEDEWTLGRLLNVLISVCNALASAHGRGVIHRDLKPANIMVGDFGAVYVMDWGLAKVLRRDGAPAPAPTATSRASKVVTSRDVEADLTQEGSILGTPVYMPPEQASGQVDAVDQRSDVYSLGAILYEMLTLQPPVDRSGGYQAILKRVLQGEIIPPEQCTPERAKAGLIPKELSAIALKAMAKEPARRYPTVEALRQDIERFQEGRSVSAKPDTTREMIWKFIKRNKVLSAAAVVVAVALAYSAGVNFLARREAEQANALTKARTEKAVPALVQAAKLGVLHQDYKNAMDQVELALAYLPDDADARLLKAQLLILDKKFSDAISQLDQYLRQRPTDSAAARLRDLCGRPSPDEVGNLLAIAHVFEQQKSPALADGLLTQHGGSSLEVRKKLLELYQQRIDKAWPGLTTNQRLLMDAAGIYRLNLAYSNATNLDPLRGMPLTSLSLRACVGVTDLTPLKGMPLTKLDLNGCLGIRDLSPLQGLPLSDLHLQGTTIDITPLKGMRLTTLHLIGSTVEDLAPLQGMNLTEISVERKAKGIEVLRSMKSLKTIWIGYLPQDKLTPEEFWKRYDAGEFK